MEQKHLPRRRAGMVVAITADRVDALVYRLAALLVAFALLAAFFPSSASALDSENIRVAKALSGAYAEVVDEVGPAVVGIETEKVYRSTGGMGGDDMSDFFERFFEGMPPGVGPRRGPRFNREPETRRSSGIGSGVIIDGEGHILTNNHVVSDADVIKIELATEKGKTFKAEVVGTDPNSDIAVIKLVDPPASLPVAKLGDSDVLKPGNIVIAIGQPLGFKQSVTQGVVSAKGRDLGEFAYERFIQTDASINPGNSGGPLVNLDGEVVGLNTMISTRGGGSIGIGFAIPINQAKKIVQQLIETGKVTRGWLGIVMNHPEDLEISREYGHDGTGVLVNEVDSRGPAAKGGIKANDLIISYDGVEIQDNQHLRGLVAETDPGRDIPVVVLRDSGTRMNLTIHIEAQPEDLYTRARGQGGRGGSGREEEELSEVSSSLGLTVGNLDDATREKHSIPEKVTSGVVVTKVDDDGEAASKGIRPGMVIVALDRQPVSDIASFRRILKDSVGKDRIRVFLYQGEVARQMMLNLK